MRGKIQVFDAVLDYSVTPLGSTNWVPVGAGIGQNMVKLKINENTNAELEIGYGAQNQLTGPVYVAQRAFRLLPGGGDYDQIFNSGMQMFARLIQRTGGSTANLTSGRLIINGFY